MNSLKTIITTAFLLMTVTAFAQTKEETVQWLRSHLQTIVTHSDDSILPFTKTRTYTFYEDAFVVKTIRDFKDKSLNGPPNFAKVWYTDIIPEEEAEIAQAIQLQQPDSMHIYSMKVAVLYTSAGTEKKSKELWYTFNEPMGLELYLPKDKQLSMDVIKRLMLLGKAIEQKDKTQ